MVRRFGNEFGFRELVVSACVTLWAATLLVSGSGIQTDGILSALSPSTRVLAQFGASGAALVFIEHRWWTVLSAGWLHVGLLHVAMNMFWLWQMGPAIVELFGPSRTMIIYTVGGIAGFTLSSIAGAFFPSLPFLQTTGVTVGASAPVFGLIGALYHYGRKGSSIIRQTAVSIIVQAVLFGLVFRGIDNYAHLGGFAGGYLMSAFLNPLTRERGNHAIVALICLAATVLAIVASLLAPMQVLRFS
jgi:rhomboid protease GluP